MEFIIVITAFLINFSGRTFSQKLDITAFEYSRKVPSIRDKELGHCVSKVEELFRGSPIEKGCTLPPKRGSTRYVSKELNDTRNFEVQNHNDVFVCMGLCDGHASSVLGLLHTGDCLAVEIAGKLTFGPKTFIKAYVEYYRSGIDFLQTDGVSPQELQQYYNGNFFLRDRSYGTMEVIILEMRYAKKKQVETLRRNQGHFQRLSSFIEHAVRDVGKPSSIKLVRLSTAKELLELLRYKSRKLDDVYSKLRQYESDIYHTREDIKRQHIKPHLRYGMYPYTHGQEKLGTTANPRETTNFNRMFSDGPKFEKCSDGASLRSTDHLKWEKACLSEVKVDTALRRQRRLVKKCNKMPVEQCVSLSKIKKSLKKVKADIHLQRSKWHLVINSAEEKTNLANKETRRLSKQLGTIGKKIKELTRIKQKERNSRKTGRKPRRRRKQ
ncbi:uncharacterized protein LOC127737812 isoform X1 [Mytilus californianus]|uniref:uncharacterized protein LOC127737812 isoform X1 n=1 Tax=Mytilus californianus TaxID=6549 RepID=UPI00224807B2|nr:uncharacterized protein LOC127737812 isoform X1 [Mytilus californianus]